MELLAVSKKAQHHVRDTKSRRAVKKIVEAHDTWVKGGEPVSGALLDTVLYSYGAAVRQIRKKEVLDAILDGIDRTIMVDIRKMGARRRQPSGSDQTEGGDDQRGQVA
jgi:hypothetical protein